MSDSKKNWQLEYVGLDELKALVVWLEKESQDTDSYTKIGQFFARHVPNATWNRSAVSKWVNNSQTIPVGLSWCIREMQRRDMIPTLSPKKIVSGAVEFDKRKDNGNDDA